MTDAATLTRSLFGKWHASYGTAPCPVCQPERQRHQNALTVSSGTDGRLLLHCKKRACDFADILVAAGVSSGPYAPPVRAVTAQRAREKQAEAEKRARQARRCWDEAQPIAGTLADTYLRTRGITGDLPEVLRFHPEAWHGPTAKPCPALVAAVQGGDGFAVHRTYLRTDGASKAGLDGGDKLMLGATAGGAVRLKCGPGSLLVGEGIESTLSAFMLHGDRSTTACAALSTSGMRGLRLPKLGSNRASLIVAVDGDGAGRDAGRDLAERAAGLGWQVGIFDPGDGADFNDVLTAKGG